MKVTIFMPKYMKDFRCIGGRCIDTCCAGWDINIDGDTLGRYESSTGALKELLGDKYFENKNNHDFFNSGYMKVSKEKRCPFLNKELLCDIHGEVGEKHLCITCKSYPRIYNIIDDVYEKSALPSCMEVCTLALLSKEKMEFIEVEEEVNEEEIEIRRIIDTESFEGTESLLQYFWEIRVTSINIMQNRNYSIEERLNILEYFYNNLQNRDAYDVLEEVEEWDLDSLKGISFKETKEFYEKIGEEELLNNIKSSRLKEVVKEYKEGILKGNPYDIDLKNYDYILENYLVNQIFKDLIPFNKGEQPLEGLNALINNYRIVKAYILGVALNSKKLNEELILRVIQTLSKDIEHNKVFKELLS